jgi:hypothetical protein
VIGTCPLSAITLDFRGDNFQSKLFCRIVKIIYYLFLETYYQTSFQDPILSRASVASTSQVHVHVATSDCNKSKCTMLQWPTV